MDSDPPYITGKFTGTIELERSPSKHYTLTLIIKDTTYQGRGEADTETPLEHGYELDGSFRLFVPPGWDQLIGHSGVEFRWGPEVEPGDGLELQIHMQGLDLQVMYVASHVATSNTSLIGSKGAMQCHRKLHPAPLHLAMPQNEYIEESIKQHGRRLDHEERIRKRIAREPHKRSQVAQSAFGLKAKLLHQRRHAEKVQLKKTLKAHDERNVKTPSGSADPQTARPTYLLDREEQKDAKALSTAVKQKRKDKAAKYAVPLPKVRGIAEQEMFKVMKTGKTGRKSWKRMITKATFVGEAFTRKPVKLERFIRPMALRFKKANVTHPDLKATFQLPIISVKKNPQSPMYTQLGVLTKGTIIEVNVSELGLVTTGGKAVWGKYAQVTNNPENDGCINAVLLV
ncbi:Ribosome biogenesis protein [Tulasnella sp. UAMH 9824]|nr:Ribosome biogenesis protein [Tulasnella sp. UAMH 9824]